MTLLNTRTIRQFFAHFFNRERCTPHAHCTISPHLNRCPPVRTTPLAISSPSPPARTGSFTFSAHPVQSQIFWSSMFRRKRNLGTVTVFEDDEPIPQDNYDDLGLNDMRRKDSTAQDHNQMTASELEALALNTAQTGREGTQRALRMAVEAREIGVTTAETMHKQTAQLEKMSEDIEVVHDYLDKSERLIDKMTKPKISRLFQRKKGNGKGLDKVKATKKERANRELLRGQGLDAVDLEEMSDSQKALTLEQFENDRNELFDSETVQDYKRGRRGKRKEPEVKQTRQITQDYSQYSGAVASVMRQQDEDLDQISDALTDMKALASAMNNELDYQDKLIGEVQDFTQETSRRTKENAKKINRIK